VLDAVGYYTVCSCSRVRAPGCRAFLNIYIIRDDHFEWYERQLTNSSKTKTFVKDRRRAFTYGQVGLLCRMAPSGFVRQVRPSAITSGRIC